MAVEAIGAVVIQRVTDLLIQRSTFFDKFIDQVEDIRLDLRGMRGFLIDAERRLKEDSEAKIWADKYLKTLFSLEDETEKYALGLAKRRRSYIVFLERQTGFFFHDWLGSGRALRHRLENIKKEIRQLNETKPPTVEDASLQGYLVGSCSDDEGEETGAPATGMQRVGGGEKETKKRDNEGCASTSSVIVDWTSPGSIGNSLQTFSDKKRDSSVVGFSNDVEKLVHRLKRKADGQDGLITVVGPSGSGKSTLMRSVYKRLDIKAHFGDGLVDCRVWVHLPSEQHASITGLCMKMVQQITKSKESGTSDLDQLRTRLADFLKEEEQQKKRRYLIVLDSVQSLDVWEKLSLGFPGLDQRESKVVLITRDVSLADTISCSPHTVAELNEEDSWKLFLEKLCPDDQDILRDHPIFRSKILKKCDYRPFNIVLLGGLLSTKALGYDEWSWYLSQTKWQKMDILSLSYNDLHAHSKLCLLYMSLFPTEVDISVRRLQRLWLAEGFVRRSAGMNEEESVEECFNDLIKRNLVKISKLKSDDSSRNCRLPCAVRDFLLPKAREVSLFHIHGECEGQYVVPSSESTDLEPGGGNLTYRQANGLAESSTPSHDPDDQLGVRRIIEYADIKNYNPGATSTSPNLSSYEDLRSYLSFNFQRNDTPAKEVEKFISKSIGSKGFGLLRVLDLEGVYKPILSETLKRLSHLRYLGLRWTFTDHLPDCFGDLPYLETLDLKRTYINSLPNSIWKLKHLRYLNLPDVSLEYEQKRRPSSFTELQTLLGLVVDERAQVRDDLDQLLKLRELGLTCQLHSLDEKNVAPLLPDLWSWIQKLKNIRSLWLKSKDERGRPSKITLEPLSNLDKLSHMSLMGNLEKLVVANQFPPNLKVLCLSVTQLKDDPMPILSQLLHLSVLRLRADSFLGHRIVCPRNGFVNLRTLKIWMLKNLAEWEVEEQGLPCLKELNIRKCHKLKEIPLQVLTQGTLEEVTLTSMLDNFVQKVRDGAKDFHIVINVNDYDFTQLPWERTANTDLWQAQEL